MTRRSRYAPALVLALGMLLAACQQSTGPAPGFSLPDVAGSTSDSMSTPPLESGDGTTGPTRGPGDTTSPDDVYIPAQERALQAAQGVEGRQFGTEEFGLTMRDLTQRAEIVESLISECMARSGFEYVPVDFTTIRRAMVSDKTAAGLSSAQYVAQYGHGISTQEDKPIVEIGLGEQNRQILQGLSEADRVAYIRTLWGEHDDATFAFGLESEDFSRTGGCTREAIEQVFDAEEISATYFNPADALILLDPRAQDALTAYASCMSDAGFGYAHPDDVDFDLQIKYDALVRGRAQDELTPDETARLAQLQDEERAVTAASDNCEVRHLEPILDLIEEEFFGRS